MKKLFLTFLFVAFSLLNSANAGDECPYWEHGQIVDDNSQSPIVNDAPNAFCWDPISIQGILFYNGGFYVDYKEGLRNYSSSTYNWLADFRKEKAQYVKGDSYYGVIVELDVHGIFAEDPMLKIGYNYGVIINKTNFRSPSGDILNGKRYTFFVPIRKSTISSTFAELDINNEMLEVIHYGQRVNRGSSNTKVRVQIK